MEGDKHNSSAFPVPGIIQDLTLLSTPLPQATSTATKKSSTVMEKHGEANYDSLRDRNLDCSLLPTQPDLTTNSVRNNNQQAQMLDSTFQKMNELQEQFSKEMADFVAAQKLNTLKNLPVSSYNKNYDNQSAQFDDIHTQNKGLNDGAFNGLPSSTVGSAPYDQNSGYAHSNRKSEDVTKDFEFLVPSLPLKTSTRNNMDGKLKRDSVGMSKNIPTFKNMSGKIPTSGGYKGLDTSSSNMDYLSDLPEKLSEISKGYGRPDYESDRISVSSSNSSLGILPPDALEGVDDNPITNISFQDKLDLSQRLAEQLNLDTSNIKGMSLDISQLAGASLRQALAERGVEDKENRRVSSLSAQGYSSDSSSSDQSHNNTAREFTRLSGGLELPEKEQFSFTKKLPLSERNSLSSRDSFTSKLTKSSRLSVSSNPWGDMSKVSIASDMFESGEDAEARLRKDEVAWRGELGRDSIRSLSGIYGDGDISIRTQGEKLSISSFFRSGSGPLGCLEKADDTQRPTFGLAVVSPQKKSKARPILPPSEDKLTFCVDQVPTRDTTVDAEKDPWNVESLVEQFSMVHGDRESDVSVPSLSYIGELLAEMKEGLTPKDIMDRLMNASKKVSSQTRNNKSQLMSSSVINLDSMSLSHCGDHQKLKTIPAVVDGERSFCRGYESDRSTRYSSSFCSRLSLDEGPPAMARHNRPTPNTEIITINDTVDPSVCNITDFGGEEEEEYVCVLTPESMDFDVFNDFSREQHYIINKACYVNGQRRDAAALIHIPVSRITLQPGEKRVVSVTVAALIGETIKIKVEVTRFDPMTQEREVNNVFGKIVAEIPKISLLHSLSVNMKPVGDEKLKHQGMMVLQNNGRSVVPVKLTLVQLNHLEVDMFFLDREKTTSVMYRLEPGQTLKQMVNCLTPPIFECSRTTGQKLVNAQVQVTLATSAQVELPPITAATFTARLSPNFFCVPASLTMTSDSSLPCQVYNSGTQPYSFQATVTSGFIVQPSIFTAQPQQTVTLMITCLSRTFKKGILTLNASEMQSKSSGKFYTIQLQGTGSCSTSSSVSATPQNSRPTSPISPCSSIGEGGLQLACTHKQLVWGGCPLQQRVVKSCSLKNLNTHREKLRLSLSGPHNCFKILTEKKTVESEMLASLQPMENCQVSVVMLASSPGPKWGHLTISRISQPQDKKVLLLYAFGGKAHVNIEGVMTDPEQHMWLYLDPDTLSSTFVLTNMGDYAAFFKISEGMTATTVGGGLSVSPPEQIIEPGHSMSVDINLSVTPDRLEYLLAKSSQKAICITRLTVTNGDESTRQRLSRLSRVQPKLAEKLSQLNQLPSTAIPDLDRLGDPYACAESLWLEDICEWTIGVLVERSALETLRLDTSIKFVDLATTVLHG